MKVLHLYKTSLPSTMGGVEQVIHQLAKGSSDRGVECCVFSLSREKVSHEIDFFGYKVYRVREDMSIASTSFSLSAFLRFYQLSQKYDIIHYHFPWPFMDVLHLIIFPKKVTVVTYHSDIVRQKFLLKIYKPLKKLFLSAVTHIVATSPNYMRTSDVLSRYLDKTSVIPIGIDEKLYPTSSPEELNFWRKKLPGKFFLFVGVLRYYKGLNILIQAAKLSSYPIVIIGAGPVEGELRDLVSKYAISNVRFLGAVSEVDKVCLLMICFSVVFPSHLRSEAFGVSLLEGAMFGKALISSEIGTGTSYVNIHQETGLVVSPGDPVALHEAMKYLWENESIAQEMGKQAKARYYENFTSQAMVSAYLDLYEKLLIKKY